MDKIETRSQRQEIRSKKLEAGTAATVGKSKTEKIDD